MAMGEEQRADPLGHRRLALDVDRGIGCSRVSEIAI
jgi:hypothetical protein